MKQTGFVLLVVVMVYVEIATKVSASSFLLGCAIATVTISLFGRYIGLGNWFTSFFTYAGIETGTALSIIFTIFAVALMAKEGSRPLFDVRLPNIILGFAAYFTICAAPRKYEKKS